MNTYIIRKGDTLWHIARIHGMDVNHLMMINPEITNPNVIYPGQVINIEHGAPQSYIVKKGDDLWSIANDHGMALNQLLMLNPQISNPALIYPGQVINMTGMPPSSPNTGNTEALASEVIHLVNEERQKRNISPLKTNNELSNVARDKSEDFIKNNYFSHNSPIYGTPFDMISSFGITYTAAAENIASGQRTAKEAMDLWMDSPGHRANILSTAYDEIGVGVAKDSSGKLYWTQLFIKE